MTTPPKSYPTYVDKFLVHPKKMCVYRHLIDGQIFYVGKGKPHRPFETTRRNSDWINMVKGRSFNVEIVGWYDSDSEARAIEKQEILTLKPMANQMLNGYTPSARNRELTSKRFKGRIMSDETKRKLRATCESRMVSIIDQSTGIRYESIREAVRETGVNRRMIMYNLNGHSKKAGGRVFKRVDSETIVGETGAIRVWDRQIIVG